MKRTKKLLSFFLAIMMVITTIPAFTLTTNAATTVTFTNTGYKLISGTTSNVNERYAKDSIRGRIEVCNDGTDTSFCAGFWTFSMPAIPSNAVVDSASITADIPYVYSTNKGVKFYATNGDFNTTHSFNSTKISEKINYVVKSGSNRAADAYALFNGHTMIDLGTFSEKNKTNTSFTSDANTIKDAVNYAVRNNWTNFNIFAYQPNSGGGSGTSWSDASIKLPTISLTYSTKTYTVAELKTVMTTFENKMRDGNTYTNVDTAYLAYVEASKAYDSYHYGLKTDINLNTYVNDLTNAINNMSIQSVSVNSINPGGFNGDSTSYSYSLGNTHQNLLYSPRVNYTEGTNYYINQDTRGGAYSDIRLAYPTTVLYYDGSVNTPKFPVFSYIKRINDGIIYVRNIYPVLETTAVGNYTNQYLTRSNIFQFDQTWRGQSNGNFGTDFLTPWFGTYNSAIEVTGIAGNYLQTSYTRAGNGAWKPNWERASNVLSYKGIPNEAMNVYTLKWYKCSNEQNNTVNLYSTVFEPNMKIYVLNIKGIASALNTKRESVKDISKFKENKNNSVSNMLESYDNLVRNYDGLDYSKAESIRTDLNTQYNNLKNRAATADNQNGYPAIRAAIDTPKQIPALVAVGDSSTYSVYDLLSNDNADGKFTTSSYSTFKDAYDTVKNYMANVVTDGYTGGYTDVAAKALNDAINSLQVVADFTTITANYTEASNLINTADSSLYTTSTWAALVNAKNNATFATYTDTQKKDTGKSANQATIDSQATALRDAIDNLAQKADFGSYNNALNNAINNVLPAFANKNQDRLPIYDSLKAFNDIRFYSQAEQDDTPESEQSTVTRNANKIVAANNSVYEYEYLIDQSALKGFIARNFDLDVVDNTNITTQKNSAKGLYETVTFNGTDYYSLNVANQAELDSNIARYINSINSTLGKYDIKVPDGISVAVSGQTQTPTSTTDGISTYRLTYGVPITFTSTNKETAWYMSYVSNVAQRGEQYQCSGLTYATKVMGNMTVTPKSSSNSNTPNKVTVIRQYSNGGNTAMLIDYVGNSFTLPAVQTYPNYTFTGYEVAAGSNATIENGTVTGITGDTVIYAKYDALGSDCRIIVTDTNGTRTEKEYKYNSAVSLNDPNAYAWIEKPIGSNTTWRPSYIGTGCSYKVTEPMELKAVTKAEFDTIFSAEAFAPNLRANGPLVADGIGVVFHGQFINYVPAGAEIVEYGVAVNVNNANSFDLINTNGKVIRCKSTNPMKSNQFSVGARYNGTTFTNSTTISYRSYMIYQITVNGQLETKYVYSDVRHFPENA